MSDTSSHVPGEAVSLPDAVYVQLGGVPTVVVDQHHHAYPHLHFLERKPALLLHIDHHDDMTAPLTPTIEQLASEAHPHDLMTYTATSLGMGSFLCPAFHYGLVGGLYHWDPREESVTCYGRPAAALFVGAPQTTDQGGRLRWQGDDGTPGYRPPSVETGLVATVAELAAYRGPLVVDIDLDAFVDATDPDYDPSFPGVPDAATYRLQVCTELLQHAPRPDLITIAESSVHEGVLTPPQLVKPLLNELLVKLDGVYANH
ncbi:hypothetical protein AUJ68_05075 [Candidatus Woesearchaeota archaeon CG1_02_57_44]|nr:MAG: hypothetical protein AUJ68_05075 [Candidatus Woesearchaeota archaeon CG1_02_57_44]PIN70793.1 MAG: hypothetical protein COV94_01255 [Candidatus Woesearchaeota archaeon CG11_big_fil_rev_8_21_14_0_20_57_5]